MPTIEANVEIAQPPATVAAAFLDPGNAEYWTTDLDRFEVVSREPGEVGSVAHLHYIQDGRPYVLEEMIPNQYFKSSVTGGGLKAQVETWLEEIDDGTEVKIRWSGSGSTLLMRIILPFMRGAILNQTKKELAAFKTLVETRSSRFY